MTNARIELLCEVCGEEFVVTPELYRTYSGVVPCPLCGSHDLVLLTAGDEPGERRLSRAAPPR